MTGICVRTRSVTATAFLPLDQPFPFVRSGDTEDLPDLGISVAARSLEGNGPEPDLGRASARDGQPIARITVQVRRPE
jgi:hypothetical protein